jgi:hypothetical protein
MTKKHRRPRKDTVSEQIRSLSTAPVEIPDYVRILAKDRPFFEDILECRTRDSWNKSDIFIAADLARCRRRIEEFNKLLDKEDFIQENPNGTVSVNPLHKILEDLTAKNIKLTRLLQIHAEAVQGRSRDTAKRAKKERELLDSMPYDPDGLLARRVNVHQLDYADDIDDDNLLAKPVDWENLRKN